MARPLSSYVCQSCGARTRQYFGRCSGCGGWNTLVEQAAVATDSRRSPNSDRSTDGCERRSS
ncbi:MAG: DNA repair protein RadA, partial [Cyanobium sp. ELA712]